jgi:hypothetical protein
MVDGRGMPVDPGMPMGGMPIRDAPVVLEH